MHPHHRIITIPAFCLYLCLSLLTTIGCQAPETDEDPIRIDATPHANLVKQAKQDWTWIAGTTWVVTSIEGIPPIENTTLWIKFEEHTWFTGSAGCNHINASYSRKGIDGLQITQVASTKMHCAQPQGTMQQESRFLHLLKNIDSYQAETNTLTLSTNATTMLTFSRASFDDEE